MDYHFVGPDAIREWQKVERLYRRFPTIVLRDVAVDAGAEAIKHALPIARKPDYEFTDRTGRLRKSIRTHRRRNFGKRTGKSLLSVAYIRAGGAKAPHAHLVHQGHGGPSPAAPRPFLTNAVEKASPQMFQTFHNVFLRQMPPAIQAEARRLLIRPYRGIR